MACPFMQGNNNAPASRQASSASAGTGLPASGSALLAAEKAEVPATRQVLGFETGPGGFKEEKGPLCHYSDYLEIEKLFSIQSGPASSKPNGRGMMHHEENLFVITHQSQELWFKLAIADAHRAMDLLNNLWLASHDDIQRRVADTLHFLKRIEYIFNHNADSFKLIETMHPSDFLEFRDFLMPASGFQSASFRRVEVLLGVAEEGRATINGTHVFTPLSDAEKKELAGMLREPTMASLVNGSLSKLNVPPEFPKAFIAAVRKVNEQMQFDIARCAHDDPKANAIIEANVQQLQAMMDDPSAWVEGLPMASEADAEDFKRAVHGALFAVSYRHEPRFALIAMLLDQVVAVEEGMLLWRGRHLHMAERMIGRRIGTGGSSGVGYLDNTRRYRIFHAMWLVRKMAVRSSALPPLSEYSLTNNVFRGESALSSPAELKKGGLE